VLKNTGRENPEKEKTYFQITVVNIIDNYCHLEKEDTKRKKL